MGASSAPDRQPIRSRSTSQEAALCRKPRAYAVSFVPCLVGMVELISRSPSRTAPGASSTWWDWLGPCPSSVIDGLVVDDLERATPAGAGDLPLRGARGALPAVQRGRVSWDPDWDLASLLGAETGFALLADGATASGAASSRTRAWWRSSATSCRGRHPGRLGELAGDRRAAARILHPVGRERAGVPAPAAGGRGELLLVRALGLRSRAALRRRPLGAYAHRRASGPLIQGPGTGRAPRR
jgi:hypothetical protein